MSPGLPKWYRSFWRGEFIELIELVHRIQLIDAIGLIAAISNIESVDLIDEITAIGRIDEIGAAYIRRDLLVNPCFETGDLRGWLTVGSPIIQPATGGVSAYCVALAADYQVNQNISIVQAKDLSLTFYGKGAAAGQKVDVRLWHTDETIESQTITLPEAWGSKHVEPATDKPIYKVGFKGNTENTAWIYVDGVAVEEIHYALRDASFRAIGLPVGQYLETPGTLSDGEYHHLTLTEDKKLRTYDPTAARESTVQAVEGKLDVPPLDAVMALLLDEGAGTTAYDASLQENNGTITDADWVDSPHGKAPDFDGDGDYVTVPHDASITFTSGDFSTEMLLKLTYGEGDVLLSKGLWQVDGWYLIQAPDRALRFVTSQLDARQDTITGTNVFTDGEWFHLMVVRDGVKVYIYVDNVDETVTQPDITDPATSARDLYVMRYDTLGNEAIGQVKRVRIFNRALTADDRTALYESSRREVEVLTHPEYGLPATMRQVEKLAGSEGGYASLYTGDTTEKIIRTIETTTRKKLHSFFMDLSNLTQDATIRVKHKVDGTNFRTIKTTAWTVGDDPGYYFDEALAIAQDLQVTLQSAVAEAEMRTVPYYYILEDME